MSKETEGIKTWLTNKEGLMDKELVPMKQKKIEPWTWLRLESRNVVIEIANKIEEEAIKSQVEMTGFQKEYSEPCVNISVLLRYFCNTYSYYK